MMKATSKPFPVTPDIIVAGIIALLPWVIHESSFLELMRWAAIIYLLGAALLYKYFSLRRSEK
jgi:hypothetical protein